VRTTVIADWRGRMRISSSYMKSILIVVLLTSIASAEWQKMNVQTTASFRGLSVVSENVVWASGTEGTVIRTVDGGRGWSVMTVPGAEKLDFRGIKAFDEKIAVIISSGPAEKGQARIYRTADGGATWKQVYEDKRPGVFFDAVAFWDHRHGIVLSDPIEGKFGLFITEDGGVTWSQLPPSALPPALPNEGAFAASNSCLAVYGDGYVWFATGGAKVARVFRSRDRGKRWSVAETPMHPANASSGIFSLAFVDANFGIAAGGDYANPGASDLPNLLISSDGGKTWRIGKPKNHPGFYLSSIAIEPNKPIERITAVGITGLYFASLNDDEPWRRGSEENLNTVVERSQGAWAVGPKGTVLHSVIVFSVLTKD
jgi:photosystem II stability/assembly factor-like uncharacterized protein